MENIIEKIEESLDNEDISLADKMIKRLPVNSPYRYYFIAESRRIEGFLKHAKDNYLIAIKSLKNIDMEKYFNSLLKISSIYRSEGDKKNTLKYIKLAEKIRMYDSDLLVEKAMYYRMRGDFNKAISIFSKLKRKYISEK
jgi:hypothetical protein